jgi:hypothetical protein
MAKPPPERLLDEILSEIAQTALEKQKKELILKAKRRLRWELLGIALICVLVLWIFFIIFSLLLGLGQGNNAQLLSIIRILLGLIVFAMGFGLLISLQMLSNWLSDYLSEDGLWLLNGNLLKKEERQGKYWVEFHLPQAHHLPRKLQKIIYQAWEVTPNLYEKAAHDQELLLIFAANSQRLLFIETPASDQAPTKL